VNNIYPLSTWLINVPLILSGNWISQLYMLHLDCLKLRGAVILLIKRANIIPAISYSLNYIGLAVSKLLGLSLLVPAVPSQCHVYSMLGSKTTFIIICGKCVHETDELLIVQNWVLISSTFWIQYSPKNKLIVSNFKVSFSGINSWLFFEAVMLTVLL